MPRDSGVFRFQKRTYTDRRFYPQREREWIPQGLLVSVICSFTCVDTAHIMLPRCLRSLRVYMLLGFVPR